MYYSNIATTGSGFTNQIFALITSIINAYKKGEKIVIVDNFLNDINNPTYTPISKIFNINKINMFLKENYDIIIIDKYDIQFELLSIKYGTSEINYIDLTDYIKENYFKDNKLVISKKCCFNDIKGDPCFGIVKHVLLEYKINGYNIQVTYDEQLKSNIEINFNGPYIFTLGWIDSYNDNMFDKILKNINYNDDFELKSELIINKINKKNKINIIHLRIEDDAIKHWSKMNNIDHIRYKTYLEKKYIDLIKKYISKTDENIILSSSLSNGVIDFLSNNNYNYYYIDKFFEDREKNAIVDLLVSKYCNNIFIGNFNIKNRNGSTFSYYIWQLLNENVSKIYIDLDKIYDKEIIVSNNNY
jgi:hypothetical protein